MKLRAVFKFRLYIAADTHNSAQAVANLNALCRAHLADRHEIEVVDVFREPQRALAEGIRMTPTLIKLMPRQNSQITGETRGWIVPIGGAENKENDRHILERFVRVDRAAIFWSADIVVIPTASRMHETGPRYEKLFKELGAAEVTSMDFDTRRDCQEAGRLRRIEEATGIFFTGGNQLRLTTMLGGTPVAKLIRARNAHGVHGRRDQRRRQHS
jgi:hypothetical protein